MLQSQRLFTLLSIFFLSQFAFAQTTYTVTSTSKDGPGSINEAIDFANINPGADIIEFTPGLQINATHLGYIPGGLADYMLNITESVTIDGKGGALIGSQRWIDGSGDWNSLIACPGNIPSGSILAAMPNFMQVGTIGVDNTGITVTVKNLSIEQFNSIAEVRDNAVLEFENFNAKKIWSTLSCLPRSLLNAGTGSSISIKNSQFTDTKNWGTLGFASEINSLNAGDLTIENTLFFNNNGGDSFAISWDGQANSKVNIVSSRFLSSGGIQVSGNVSVSNIVNSIWVNRDTENPKFGDRIINDASGDMNITASSLMWNNNNCDFSCQTEQNSRPLIVRKGAGKINFIQSAIGINFPSGSATLVNTLGNTGTGDGFTADDNTYIQPTTIQDATALKTITSQPSLYTTGIGTAFNNEVLSYTFNFDVEMVTPAFPGELIDQILSNKVLLHPITNAPITEDVLGNDRVDANGDRNIGAIQVSLAPFLSLVGIGEGIVDLGWTEPLHHDGLPILRYEIEYFDGGFNPISIIIDPPVLSKTISSLANGTEHTFYVRAIYDNGGVEAEGPLSNEVAATPLGSMIAPTLTATPGNTEVALSWNLPDLGGRTFQQYTILWYEQVSGDFVGAHTIADPNETTYIVTGLTNGTIYDFKITARASEDTSPAGTASATPDALPIAICQPFTAQLDANGTVTILPSDVDGGSSDPDGGSVTLSLDNDTFTCADIGINTVTLTVTNNVSPNSTATCTAAVTVVDNIAPVIACPADLTVNTNPSVCFATVSFPDALATDYCGIDTVVQTGGLPTGSMFPVGVNTVEYTATDVNGNTAVCSFTITVTDNEPAVAVCQDITIQLDANGDATIVAADVDGGSTDNCGIASIAIDIDTFTCADVGPNDVILTVTDGNGNVSSCIAVVTVEDVTAPVAVCMDITVQLDATGTITILGSDVDGGSSDACGIASFDLDIDTFDCTNVGPNTVTVTVTDVNGNVSTCTAVVTVEDVTMPELVCMDITLELGADGTAMITPADVSTATDACGINTTAVDIENFDCSDIGTPVTVTVFAVDNNGNLQSCNALVTVVDLFAPVVTCPADQTVDPGPGNLFYEVPDYFATGEATATDNCTDPLTIFSQDPAPGTLLPDGTYTVTMSAEDEYGNVGTCTFELTVESVLGINDNGIDISTIVMNPNPAIYVVNISNPQNIELEQAVIYDVTGRLVQTYDLKDMGTEKALDISMLSTAAYVVMIQGPEGQVTKQLIKE